MESSAYHEKKDISYLLILGVCVLAIMLLFYRGFSQSLVLRALGIGYFIGSGFLTTRRFFGFSKLSSLFLAPLINILPLTIVGSAAYIVGTLSVPILTILLWIPLCVTILAVLFPKSSIPPYSKKNTPPLPFISLALCGVAVFLLSAFCLTIFAFRTTDSLLGPWDHISPVPFILYFLATLVLGAILLRNTPPSLSLSMIAFHFFASLSVAVIRFPLGFGFDPILHHAAERIVVDQGVILPKTFYYIGQYVLVPFFARLFALPVEWIHQPLLSIITALSVPPLAFYAVKSFFRLQTISGMLCVLFFLAIPYLYLVTTTPWGLAYTIILLTLLSSALASATQDSRFNFLTGALTLFTLALHPLAGIPLCFFLALQYIFLLSYRSVRHAMLVGMSILVSVSVPLAFFVNSLVSPSFRVSLRMSDFSTLLHTTPLFPVFDTRFSPFLDFVYFFSFNGWILFVFLAVLGALLLYKRPRPYAQRHFLIVCLIIYGALRINALLTVNFIHFETLASFEQQDYAERLIRIADLFLLPFVGYALSDMITRILQKKEQSNRLVGIFFLAGMLTASLYLSYPNNDAYTPFHGHTLSSTDIGVVRAIDRDGGDKRYIVIANQVVASAAIHEFGFKKYYTAIIEGALQTFFYYPIPSGSPLAPYYYSMLRAPLRTTMTEAMRVANVTTAYFVIRDYEPRFPIIVRDAKKSSDSWKEIDGGKAYMFIYQR